MTDARSKTWSFTYDTKGRLVRDDDPAGGYKTLTRTQLGTNDWQVALATRLGATKTYKVEHVSDGSEKRTYIAPTSLVATSSTNPAAASTNVQPTGMLSAVSSSIDPRFGMLSPVHSSTTSTPGGLSNSIASSRSASRNGLALPLGSDPLSFTQLVETTSVNGGSGAAGGSTFTSVYDAVPRRWTFTSST